MAAAAAASGTRPLRFRPLRGAVASDWPAPRAPPEVALPAPEAALPAAARRWGFLPGRGRGRWNCHQDRAAGTRSNERTELCGSGPPCSLDGGAGRQWPAWAAQGARGGHRLLLMHSVIGGGHGHGNWFPTRKPRPRAVTQCAPVGQQ
uniref:Uncharacterized protein n=1 Tax=Myotis myotis TaxID=51298 RepID=A0A7J7VYD2_MYOMY|nr:hypothetical protein mMyoMyo1_012195 [Myotis myotis]